LDSPETSIKLALTLCCIIANGFFVLTETAILETHKSKLEKLSNNDDRKLQLAIKIMDDPERFLSAMQIGITLMSILIGTLAGAELAPILSGLLSTLSIADVYADLIAFICSVVFITYLNLIIGELVPKKIAGNSPETILLHFSKLLNQMELSTRPFVHFLSTSTNMVLAIFGISPRVEEAVTEDEVKNLIEQGTEDGTFEKTEQDMVDRIFHMSDQTAYALMRPRTQMFWLDLADSLDHNLKLIKENPDTIFPVGKDNLDDFAGVLYAKDLLNAAINKQDLNLAKYLRKPMFIPRSMESFRVLEKFKETGTHEAIVLDEYGGVVGFITIKDIISGIIGDISLNNEPEPIQIIRRDDQSWLVDGLYSIDDFKEKFELDELPDEDPDHYQTMGGFITSYLGYIPKEAEKFTWNNFTFEILDMDRARIDKIMVIKEDEATDKEPSAEKTESELPI